MRRTATTVLTLAAALACGACGSQSTPAPAPSSTAAQSTTAAAAPAQGGGQQCQALSWPQKLPDFRGKSLGDTVVGPALCYDIATITAGDGTDVMHNPTAMTKSWTVTGESPAPGTQVTAETPITLKVTAAQ